MTATPPSGTLEPPQAPYRATAVDVGHLKEILEEGVRLFDMNDVRERWSVDLLDRVLAAPADSSEP